MLGMISFMETGYASRAVYIGSKRVALHKMGALLYRMALSAFLEVSRPEVPSDWERMTFEEKGKHMSDGMDFSDIQTQFEDAFIGCGKMRPPRR